VSKAQSPTAFATASNFSKVTKVFPSYACSIEWREHDKPVGCSCRANEPLEVVAALREIDRGEGEVRRVENAQLLRAVRRKDNEPIGRGGRSSILENIRVIGKMVSDIASGIRAA